MKKALFVYCLIGLSIPVICTAENEYCGEVSCHAGDKARTYATDTEPYFACPTRELADYTSMVVGLIAMNIQMTGHFPNISDKTGDPEYPDKDDGGQNETNTLLATLRQDAKVNTFDEAVSQCSKGKSGLNVIILNIPGDSSSAWVSEEKAQKKFWMPQSSLNRIE